MDLKRKSHHQIDSLICGNIGIVRTEKCFVVIIENDIIGPFLNSDMPNIHQIIKNPDSDFSKMKLEKVYSWK